MSLTIFAIQGKISYVKITVTLICSPKDENRKRKSAASVSSFCYFGYILTGKGDKIKKGAPPSPQTFVNLKSNTMKNTMQRYNFSLKLPNVLRKNYLCFNFDRHLFGTLLDF